jgi:hypothetical protein
MAYNPFGDLADDAVAAGHRDDVAGFAQRAVPISGGSRLIYDSVSGAAYQTDELIGAGLTVGAGVGIVDEGYAHFVFSRLDRSSNYEIIKSA